MLKALYFVEHLLTCSILAVFYLLDMPRFVLKAFNNRLTYYTHPVLIWTPQAWISHDAGYSHCLWVQQGISAGGCKAF